MGIEKIFSFVFDESKVDPYRWVENKRHGPMEFFGKKPGDKLDPKKFTEPDGSPRIPPDIGDAFNYSADCQMVTMNFGQYYYNCSPLSVYQYLKINFGSQRNPENRDYDNPLANAQGFEYLTAAFIFFYRGQHGTPLTEIGMESQNLGMHQEGESTYGDNVFTDRGNNILIDLISQKANILRINGLADADHKDLEVFLDLIKNKYDAQELVPRTPFYT
ncbi:hypothetical protein H6503_04575 [Candidatus Woesearchaeota archaeon]|nr:hypothetical protein [Candidatus Woesearchaeota archaeon]